MDAVAQGSVDLDGRRLGWRVQGEGPVVLLLQGYAGTAADWDPTFVGALAERATVVCPDHRGMGQSSFGDDDEPLTIASMAADAASVLDAVGAEGAAGRAPATVVGWSMGGFVAQALTCAEPDRVAALVLLGTDQGGPGAIPADPAVWARLIDDSGPPSEQATRLLHLLFPEAEAARVDAEVGELVAAARAVLDPQVLRAQEAAMDEWHAAPPPTLPAVLPPTAVVAGSEDEVIPPSNARLLGVHWSAVRADVLDGAGHAVMAQEPARVAAVVTELMERAGRVGGT